MITLLILILLNSGIQNFFLKRQRLFFHDIYCRKKKVFELVHLHRSLPKKAEVSALLSDCSLKSCQTQWDTVIALMSDLHPSTIYYFNRYLDLNSIILLMLFSELIDQILIYDVFNGID